VYRRRALYSPTSQGSTAAAKDLTVKLAEALHAKSLNVAADMHDWLNLPAQ
jgi:hypothetical protein